MSALIIDGKAIANKVRNALKQRTEKLAQLELQPGLAVVLVGDNPASSIYVRNKAKACKETGIHSEIYQFPDDTAQATVLEHIHALNHNPKIHGILIQLPLPSHFDTQKIIASIAIEKDVDGFHPCNVGALSTGNARFYPCTPYGVMTLLKEFNLAIEGQHAVVVGRSNIVGKPMAYMLLEKGATVTICTSKTQNLSQYTESADILVVATGRPQMITAAMVRPGSVIIDVGINRLVDGRLCGDVDFASVKEKVGYITPVPGGVGPMTITMLLSNTIEAAERVQSAS